MNNKNNLITLITIAFLATSTIAPISEQQANILSAVAGSAVGAATLYEQSIHNKYGVKPATMVVAGTGLSFWISKFILSNYTPEGRYQRALKTINNASSDKLLTSAFSAYKDLKRYLKIHHINDPSGDCYLVLGRNKLVSLSNSLEGARQLLQHARGEKSASFQLVELCRAQEQVVNVLMNNCNIALELVDSNSEEYYRQRKLYDSYLKRAQLQGMMQQKENHHAQKLSLEGAKFGYQIGKDAIRFTKKQKDEARSLWKYLTGFIIN